MSSISLDLHKEKWLAFARSTSKISKRDQVKFKNGIKEIYHNSYFPYEIYHNSHFPYNEQKIIFVDSPAMLILVAAHTLFVLELLKSKRIKQALSGFVKTVNIESTYRALREHQSYRAFMDAGRKISERQKYEFSFAGFNNELIENMFFLISLSKNKTYIQNNNNNIIVIDKIFAHVQRLLFAVKKYDITKNKKLSALVRTSISKYVCYKNVKHLYNNNINGDSVGCITVNNYIELFVLSISDYYWKPERNFGHGSYLDYLRITNNKKISETGMGWMQMLKSGGAYLHKNFVIISKRPTLISINEKNRYDSRTSPAITWEDGSQLYFLNGIQVAPHVVLAPQKITYNEIISEEDPQKQFALIKAYGYEKYIKNTKHMNTLLMPFIRHEDNNGILWGIRIQNNIINIVEVENGTPEPDGTKKKYYLAVPNTISTAINAVAWTYGMHANKYKTLAVRT